MLYRRCDEMRHWLRQADSILPPVPPAELAEHIAGCTMCRGLLIATMAAYVPAPAAPSSLSCATCQTDLDAYVDCERQHDVVVASERYPHVWWHLWSCTDCVELYRYIYALLYAEDQHELAPIPSARR